jgi:hypothetical protein
LLLRFRDDSLGRDGTMLAGMVPWRLLETARDASPVARAGVPFPGAHLEG